MKLIFVFLFLNFSSAFGFEVPRVLTAGKSNFTWHTYYDACYSMESFLDSLPCNPAYLVKSQEVDQRLYGQIFFGSDVNYLKDVKAIIDNSAKTDAINRVLNENRSSELEAELELGSLYENWAWSFSPSRISYYSLIRDKALPWISIYASQEQVLRIQYAKKFENNFSAGLQLRGLRRQLIFSEFFLTDALVEGGSEKVLTIKTQNVLFFEPGLVWAPDHKGYQPQVSLAITQLGAVDHRYAGLSTEPEGQLGVSIKPPTYDDLLELGIQASFHSQYNQAFELIRLAGSYKWMPVQIAGSFNDSHQDIGVLFRIGFAQAGIILNHEKFRDVLGRSDELNTYFFQLTL